jgi:hypothetical protein
MNFKKVPVYNASNESEDRVVNLEHIEQVKPHANVPVDPGAVSTACCEVAFHSGSTIIVLIDQPTFEQQLQALTGTIDTFGVLA